MITMFHHFLSTFILLKVVCLAEKLCISGTEQRDVLRKIAFVHLNLSTVKDLQIIVFIKYINLVFSLIFCF